MAQVIMSINNSLHKMEKLDRIDDIEARKKLSEIKMTDMVTELRKQIEDYKSPNENTPQITGENPSYADVLKTSEKSNKNTTQHPSKTTTLQTLKPTTTHTTQNEPDSMQPTSTNDNDDPLTHLLTTN